MALSKPSKDELNMQCPICSETFKSPKILPCLHTFCEQCIHEFILSTGSTKDIKLTEFSCPLCRTVVKPRNAEEESVNWASSLQDNTTMSKMIAVVEANQQQECHACKRHQQESEAKFWCKECDEAFCDDCKSKHSWMKLLSTHDVIPIQDIGKDTAGIDLKAISDRCSKHFPNAIDAYCFRHKEWCCVGCLTDNHRGCYKVKSVDNLISADAENPFLKTLTDVKDATLKVFELTEKQKTDFNTMSENVEEEAAKFLELLKCKLDELFQTFSKQLRTFRDEENTKIDVKIRLLNEFTENLDHWIKIIKVVDHCGSKTKKTVQMEKTRDQLRTKTKELINSLRNSYSVKVKFNKNKLAEQLETLAKIGEISKSQETLKWQVDDIRTLSGCCSGFEDIAVEQINCFRIPNSSLRCGVCIDDKTMIIGDYLSAKKLHFVSQENGSVTNTLPFQGEVKRFCYDRQKEQLFISCYAKELFLARIQGNELQHVRKIGFRTPCFIGAMCIADENVYVVTNNSIKKIPSKIVEQQDKDLAVCFRSDTNSEYPDVNAIAVVSDDRLVFGTKTGAIKCTTCDGKDIFTYKDDIIKKPECIAVLPYGLILVADRSGKRSLHVLSADGRSRRTLLESFQSIVDPRDIWLDLNGDILYVAGNEYIEAYRIQ